MRSEIDEWVKKMPEVTGTSYPPFLIGNDPILNITHYKADKFDNKLPLVFIGTGGLYSLLLALELHKKYGLSVDPILVILDNSHLVKQQVWEPFKKKLSRTRDPLAVGDILEGIADIIARGSLAIDDLGKGYTDQDPDLFITNVFTALRGRSPEEKLRMLKRVVELTTVKCSDWSAPNLFDSFPRAAISNTVLYPSNIGSCLKSSSVEHRIFSLNLRLPGAVVIESDLSKSLNYPRTINLRKNDDPSTSEGNEVRQAWDVFMREPSYTKDSERESRLADIERQPPAQESCLEIEIELTGIDLAKLQVYIQTVKEEQSRKSFSFPWSGKPYLGTSRPIKITAAEQFLQLIMNKSSISFEAEALGAMTESFLIFGDSRLASIIKEFVSEASFQQLKRLTNQSQPVRLKIKTGLADELTPIRTTSP